MAGGGGGGESGEFGLQIAPMLDVMFVLLLFYMVMAGSQTKEAELSVDLPAEGQPAAPQGTPPTPVYLKIGRNKQVYFNDSPVDTPASETLPALEARLKAAVKQLGPKNPFIVVPDELSPHQRIVDVLNACVEAGVENLSFGSS
jgi:biopolymer transport protein ExbD